MRSAQSSAESGVGDVVPAWSGEDDEGPDAAMGGVCVLVDGGRAPMTASGGGRGSRVSLLGLGLAIVTTIDPCGAAGGCREAALLIWM